MNHPSPLWRFNVSESDGKWPYAEYTAKRKKRFTNSNEID